MIVVVGSRHDKVAAALVEEWPNTALCSAEDLTHAGWVWRAGKSQSSYWVVSGRIVSDAEVSGVFVRRSTVYPEELLTTHPDDRRYLAAELHAFLVFVLAMTRARIAHPVHDGALANEALRPERWMPIARENGCAVAPLRLSSERQRRRRFHTRGAEVVCGDVFGDLPPKIKCAARDTVHALGLPWATLVFDGRWRLLTVTNTQAPSAAASGALAYWLGAVASP